MHNLLPSIRIFYILRCTHTTHQNIAYMRLPFPGREKDDTDIDDGSTQSKLDLI